MGVRGVWCCAVALSVVIPAAPVTAQPAATPPAATLPASTSPAATVAAPLSATPPAAAAGTAIAIAIDDHLNSRTANAGDTFRLHLAEPISVDGRVVAPAGVAGFGEVINSAPASIGGKPGELSLAVRYLDFQNQRVRIGHFRYGQTGQNNMNGAIVAGAVLGVVGYLIVGGNVDVPAGTLGAARRSARRSADRAHARNHDGHDGRRRRPRRAWPSARRQGDDRFLTIVIQRRDDPLLGQRGRGARQPPQQRRLTRGRGEAGG